MNGNKTIRKYEQDYPSDGSRKGSSRRLRKWAEQVISVWRCHEEMLMGRQLELFQKLLESKQEADKQRSLNRLRILCGRCGSEMELLFIAYLKDNELWMIGGWRWLKQRLIWREMIHWEKQKRKIELVSLGFILSKNG